MRSSPESYKKLDTLYKDLKGYVVDAIEAELEKTKEVPKLDSSGEPVVDTGQQPVMEEVPVTSFKKIAYRAGIRTDELDKILKQGSITFPQAITILSGFEDPTTTIELVFDDGGN